MVFYIYVSTYDVKQQELRRNLLNLDSNFINNGPN